MIRPAPALIAFFLRRSGFGGITLPWAAYILPERMDDGALIAHERRHLVQIERMGALRFYLAYAWQWLRYGYRDMELERQARGEE